MSEEHRNSIMESEEDVLEHQLVLLLGPNDVKGEIDGSFIDDKM